jgi:membrane-bound lytic murein transglycosylase
LADDDQNLQAEAEVQAPDWVPEKFRSNPEKFGEAYANLEREFHSTRQEVSTLQQQIDELSAAQQQQPVEQNTDQLYAMYENSPLETMAWLAEQAAQKVLGQVTPQFQQQQQPLIEQQNQLLAYTADQIVRSRVEDWDGYKDKVAQKLQESPYLISDQALQSPEATARALEDAYKVVKHDELISQTKSLAEQHAEALRQAKEQAQTLSGSAGRPAPTDADTEYWERVKNAPVARYSDLVRPQ